MPTFEVQILNKLECLLAIASPASCKPSASENVNPDSAERGAALHVEPSLAVQWEDTQHLESSSHLCSALAGSKNRHDSENMKRNLAPGTKPGKV